MGQYSEQHIEEQERRLATLQKKIEHYEWSINYHKDALADARLHLGLFLNAEQEANTQLIYMLDHKEVYDD